MKRNQLEFRVVLKRDAGPWLYVNGEYSERGSVAATKVAEVLEWPECRKWKMPHYAKLEQERNRAWHDAMCYYIRGRFGAKAVNVVRGVCTVDGRLA